MDQRQRDKLSRIVSGEIRFDCPMDQYTTFRVGGKVEALYLADGFPGLQRAVTFLRDENIPYMILGGGSNLLIRDGGMRGVAVLLRGGMATIEKNGNNDRIILAGGGTSLRELIAYCRLHGLGGLEFLTGIPGTVGGAVVMNAGAFGKEIGNLVEEIQLMNPEGEPSIADRSNLHFTYRKLSLPKGSIIVRARFQLKKVSRSIIAERVASYMKKRKEKQPLEYPSGGSIFKNPHNDYAGRLIEVTGLKGKRIGGAMISTKHANWILNTGGATARDILDLMDLIQKGVKEKTGIELEPEIRVAGVEVT